MKTYDFLMILTEKCNLNCPHCYMQKGKRSLSLEDCKKIISHLPPNPTRISLEGGEVYCERDLLYSTIQLLRQKFGKEFALRVETNGTAFYQNNETIIEEANRLHKLGVTNLKISLDDFHVLGGANLEKLLNISRTLEQVVHPLKVSYLSLDTAVAIGNAEKLPENQKQIRACMNKSACIVHPFFFTDIEGEVYTCPWRITPSLGNLKEANLEDLFRNMDFSQQRILVGDILGLVNGRNELGDIAAKKGECMVCKELFADGRNI